MVEDPYAQNNDNTLHLPTDKRDKSGDRDESFSMIKSARARTNSHVLNFTKKQFLTHSSHADPKKRSMANTRRDHSFSRKSEMGMKVGSKKSGKLNQSFIKSHNYWKDKVALLIDDKKDQMKEIKKLRAELNSKCDKNDSLE